MLPHSVRVFLGLTIFWAVLNQGQAQDPCHAGRHVELDDVRRSTGYSWQPGEDTLCDRDLQPGWYRFTSSAGGKMPETCPKKNQCGTHTPIWMNGKHPAVEDGYTKRTMCADLGSNKGNKCCDYSFEIDVKNCGDFFVYGLVPVKACSLAYCAGDKAPCPAGSWSRDGFTNCVEVYPLLQTKPTFAGPILKGNSFAFTCNVNNKDNNPNLRFEVKWVVDNEDTPIRTKPLSQGEKEDSLQGKELKNHFNRVIRCSVRAWYANTGVRVRKGPWQESESSYFVGFGVEPGQVEFTDKFQEVDVTLASTVPIVCPNDASDKCCLSLQLATGGPDDTVAVDNDCQYKLCKGDWNPQTQKATKVIRVRRSSSPDPRPVRSSRLSFEEVAPKPGMSSPLDIFYGHELPTIAVTIRQGPPLTCQWTGDPHITSFSKKYFHLYSAGSFTFYKNDKYKFELQSYNYKCWKVACQCGLLIKEETDIIYITNCDDPTKTPSLQTSPNLRAGTVVERSNDGKTIVVYLPSGRQVKLRAFSRYQNAYLTVPASDKNSGNGRGICGTPDNDPNNEFTYRNGHVEADPCGSNRNCVPAAFMNSWRTQWDNNPINGKKTDTTTKVTTPSRFCQCDVEKQDGSNPGFCRVAPPRGFLLCNNCLPVNVPNNGLKPRGRKKREAQASPGQMDHPAPPAAASQSDSVWKDSTWPTPGGITEDEARTRCRRSIESSQLYAQFSGDDKDSVIQDTLLNCILNVQFSDSFDTVEGDVDSFTDVSSFQMAQDINCYHADDQGALVVRNDIINFCDPECFRHGSCLNRTCECDSGYTGSNCQLKENEAPKLLEILGSAVCDVHEESCEVVDMDATGFENSVNFRCKVQEVTANAGDVRTLPAYFITDTQLACPLPVANLTSERSVKKFSVSVTYDGKLYSNSLDVTVFDSTCQDCDITKCQRKNETCLINDLCFRDGDLNPNDAKKVCKPSLNPSEWSDVTSSGTTLSTWSTFLVVAAILCAQLMPGM